MKKLKVIIPARGGSKGVPGKNIKEVNGIPLLGYPIIAAKDSKYISDIYVSTDSQEIKNVALEYGAQVINRPKEFADDNSLDIDGTYDDIIHLRATTPMIESNVLDKAIEFYNNNPECTSLRSAHEASETAYKSFKKVDGYWSGLFNSEYEGEYYNWNRQQLPKTYQPNGYIDIIKPSQFMNSDSLHGEKILSFVTEHAYEIDTPTDFKILEVIYGKN